MKEWKSVDVKTLRKELSKLLDTDEPINITRYGTVVAKLVPGDWGVNWYRGPLPADALPVQHPAYDRDVSGYNAADFPPHSVAAERARNVEAQRRRDLILNGVSTLKTAKKRK